MIIIHYIISEQELFSRFLIIYGLYNIINLINLINLIIILFIDSLFILIIFIKLYINSSISIFYSIQSKFTLYNLIKK